MGSSFERVAMKHGCCIFDPMVMGLFLVVNLMTTMNIA
jgi:hypothetical protein